MNLKGNPLTHHSLISRIQCALKLRIQVPLPPVSAVEVIELVASVCLCVCLLFSTLTAEPLYVWHKWTPIVLKVILCTPLVGQPIMSLLYPTCHTKIHIGDGLNFNISICKVGVWNNSRISNNPPANRLEEIGWRAPQIGSPHYLF